MKPAPQKLTTKAGIQQAALTASLFVLLALLTGHRQPCLGMAEGTLIAGLLRFLYRRYKHMP